jgi:hypothetical protein
MLMKMFSGVIPAQAGTTSRRFLNCTAQSAYRVGSIVIVAIE